MHEIQLAEETSRCRRGSPAVTRVCTCSPRRDMLFLVGHPLLGKTYRQLQALVPPMFQLEWVHRNCCWSCLVVGLRHVFLVDVLPERDCGEILMLIGEGLIGGIIRCSSVLPSGNDCPAMFDCRRVDKNLGLVTCT